MCCRLMDEYITATSTSVKHNRLWKKRMFSNKQRLYKITKHPQKHRECDEYNKHKKETLMSTRKVLWTYIKNMLIDGVNNDKNKPFW